MKNQFNRRVLFSVMGETAAVLTETLYALVTQRNFIPTEIKIVTTEDGKRKALEELLDIQKGAYHQFIKDYGDKYDLSQIHFDENSILVIQDRQGQALKDVRTLEANESAADQIVRSIGEICQDKDCQLHVSMAGGRKTMGFYAAYALSIFGRPQDKLSHVLVDREYECRGFYYPTPDTYIIENSYGYGENKTIVKIDAKEAKVELADIPFVRLGLGVSKKLEKNDISYSNAINKAQKLFDKPKITFHADRKGSKKDGISKRLRAISFGDTEISLGHKPYAFLITLCVYKQRNKQFDISDAYDDFIEVYTSIKNKSRNEQRLDKLVDFPRRAEISKIFSEARAEIAKLVQETFSISNTDNIPYIPSSSGQIYELYIDAENIELRDITDIIPPEILSD